MISEQLRNKGKKVLSTYIEKEKNIEIIEKNIFNLCCEKALDYLNI